MLVVLDTSVLSDPNLTLVAKELRRDPKLRFSISVITHFEILWGYALANREPVKYEKFLRATKAEIIPLLQTDAELSAGWRPEPADIRDALIAAGVKRHDATIWTRDSDFLKFLPREQVRLIH
ncbi:MAG: PIN domain-containing protein [Hadesarchaea archaeon]|nr:PIN domain-containing protein [Hadesarchaea archaeon]